jgi:spore coat polysaccharide biosynthesis protein SpsF
MKTIAIIQSRMSSRRLPGKNLLPIVGRPMLARLLDRLKLARKLDGICIATSTEVSDDPIESLARQEGVLCFRGSLEDVLDRVYHAARACDAGRIVEITGDCPLTDPAMVDAMVARHEQGDADYVYNVLDRVTFPVGFDVQIYSSAILEQTWREASDPYDRNNVTPYLYHHPNRFRLLNMAAPADLVRPDYFLCVDEARDLTLVRAVFEHFLPQGSAFDARSIIGFLDRHPDLVAAQGRIGPYEHPQSGGQARQEQLLV